MRPVAVIIVFVLALFLLASCSKEKDVVLPLPPPPAVANKPPVANAGRDTTITLPVDQIWLDGSASYDSDGRIISFEWRQISGPELWGSMIYMKSAAAEIKQTLNVAGTYQFQLTVSDKAGAFARDTFQVVVHDFTNPPELSGREVVFDNPLFFSGPEHHGIFTPVRPDLFLNPYVKVEVFLKFDSAANWIQVKPWREQGSNSSFYQWLFLIEYSYIYISVPLNDLSGLKASIKVKFL